MKLKNKRLIYFDHVVFNETSLINKTKVHG